MTKLHGTKIRTWIRTPPQILPSNAGSASPNPYSMYSLLWLHGSLPDLSLLMYDLAFDARCIAFSLDIFPISFLFPFVSIPTFVRLR